MTAPKVVTTAPPRIWLQVSDAAEDVGNSWPTSPRFNTEITWSPAPAVACEVEYIRADLAESARALSVADGSFLAAIDNEGYVELAVANGGEATRKAIADYIAIRNMDTGKKLTLIALYTRPVPAPPPAGDTP